MAADFRELADHGGCEAGRFAEALEPIDDRQLWNDKGL